MPSHFRLGDTIPVTRILRSQGSLKEGGFVLGILLAELDRMGFDADLIVRPKRGRPSDVSRFLARQFSLPMK